jgi:hypothetical protein
MLQHSVNFICEFISETLNPKFKNSELHVILINFSMEIDLL